jgi:3-oxoacyl-[acyl-carrier protein] reductase
LYGNFGQTNYAAAKAGVIGMTKTLAKELGRKGFTVNAVAPGFIATAMTNAMPKETLDMMAAKVPVARLGEVEDIANACLFLASEQAGYINGTVLSVDGGIVL